MKQLTVTGTWNVRELGGFHTTEGTTTRPQVLLRSGNLDQLPPASQQQLLDYGVTTVIDLRNEWEVEHFPNVFEDAADVTYRNLPLIGDALSDDAAWQAATADYEYLHELYIRYIEGCQPQIGTIITALAASDAVTIFHCHAGKDRTGIIAALVLRAMGVAPEDIAADYSLSRAGIEHLVVEWRQYAQEQGRDMAAFERNVASAPETMLQMLAFIEETYGTTAAYLRACGVSAASLAQLRRRLLAPS